MLKRAGTKRQDKVAEKLKCTVAACFREKRKKKQKVEKAVFYVSKKSKIKSRENISMMLYRCTIKLGELEWVIII